MKQLPSPWIRLPWYVYSRAKLSGGGAGDDWRHACHTCRKGGSGPGPFFQPLFRLLEAPDSEEWGAEQKEPCVPVLLVGSGPRHAASKLVSPMRGDASSAFGVACAPESPTTRGSKER